MPINYGSTRVNDVFYGNKRVLQIYHGSNLVYNASVGLPEGYVGLEYIEANNGQYIDTCISFNNVSKAKVEAKMVSYGGSGYPTILGCAASSPVVYGIIIGVGPYGFYEQTGIGSGAESYTYHSYPFDLNKHTFTTDFVNKTMTIDDTMDTFTHDKSSLALNVYLLRRNINGNTLGMACMCRCYSCKLWNNDNKIIANMIPAMKTSDGTVGMYDLKRRKFYSSGIADNFVAGPLQEHKLPKEYEELDYITNTSTAYIDTGIYLSGDNWDFDVEYDSLDNSISGRCIFGYQNGNSLIVPYNKSLYLQTTSTVPTTRVQENVWSEGHHRLKINTNGGNVTYKLDNVASTSYVNYTTTAFDTDLFSVKPIYLFAYWYTSAVCASNRYFLGRIHFFKMSQNGVLKCNLIPAKRISDGKIGMYDLVTGSFFTSASSTAFTGN